MSVIPCFILMPLYEKYLMSSKFSHLIKKLSHIPPHLIFNFGFFLYTFRVSHMLERERERENHEHRQFVTCSMRRAILFFRGVSRLNFFMFAYQMKNLMLRIMGVILKLMILHHVNISLKKLDPWAVIRDSFLLLEAYQGGRNKKINENLPKFQSIICELIISLMTLPSATHKFIK